MHPVLIEFGSFSIRWYGVMAAVGFLLATLVVNMNRKRADMSEDQASALLFIAIAGGVLGARIVYVYQNWTSQFKGHFSEIFRIDHGGLVFYGGFFLAMAGIIFYCRKSKLDMVKVMDAFCPALAIGHAMGRIGCFLNGCCYGKPTQCFLGVHYPHGSAVTNKFMGAAVHPVQLYETCGNILLAVFLLLLLRRAKRGITMASYMLLYGILRFSDEFFRGDHRPEQLWFGKFTPAQTVGLFLIPIGLLTLIYFLRKNGKQNNQTDNKQSE